MKTLYWHDYETWGVSPSQDKPSQFAGVRTDEDLNIIDEPLMMYCKPASDCLPHPEACLVTGLSPQKALDEGLPEPQFIQKIYQVLSQSGTCGVGYNSIRFDDEVTRYSLYRNFYDPYAREWKDGNSRWDIIDTVRLVYALRPETLEWVYHEDGSPSFKLELLSKANGIAHEDAHDALSDVYATIGLAKLIKERQPKLYEYSYGLRFKKNVEPLLDISKKKPMLHISSRFSGATGCAAIIAPLMRHPRNKNSIICFNLSVDPSPLINLSSSEILERIYTREDELPEGIQRIPLKEIHLNRSPIIVTPKMLNEEAAQRLGIDKALCEKHWQQLQPVDLTEKLTDVYSQNPFPKKTDPEQQLYDGFLNDSDRKTSETIRDVEPDQLHLFKTQLKDQRLQALLFRYRARYYPKTLSDEEKEQWEEWRYLRLTDNAYGASITLDEYFDRLSELSDAENVDQNLLQNLYEYGDSLLG